MKKMNSQQPQTIQRFEFFYSKVQCLKRLLVTVMHCITVQSSSICKVSFISHMIFLMRPGIHYSPQIAGYPVTQRLERRTTSRKASDSNPTCHSEKCHREATVRGPILHKFWQFHRSEVFSRLPLLLLLLLLFLLHGGRLASKSARGIEAGLGPPQGY